MYRVRILVRTVTVAQKVIVLEEWRQDQSCLFPKEKNEETNATNPKNVMC